MQKVKVMFVCLGNICRSPMAEAVLKSLVKAADLSNEIHIESCGTGDYHLGDNADKRTLKVLKDNGIQFTHSAQQLAHSHFSEFDYLLVMDDANLQNTLNVQPLETACTVLKIRAFDINQSELDVVDPYFGEMDGFELCYTQLLEACSNFLEYLIKKHNLNPS